MTEKTNAPSEDEATSPTAPSSLSRREIVAGTAIAGVAAMAVVAPAIAQSVRPVSGAAPKAPEGLSQYGMLDQRFPITYQSTVPEAVTVITNYFAALARRDLRGMAACLHFPFASYEGVDPVVVNSQADFMQKQPASMSLAKNPQRGTANEGYIKDGSYDVFGHLEVLSCDPVNVCVALTYYRYGPDGRRLLRSEGIYAVTNNDGRWAIQLISTIMTPADMMHVKFPDSEESAIRLRIIHDMAYHYGVDAYDDIPYQYGPTASVTNEVVEVFYQRMGNMDPYRTAGVKTRLQVRDGGPRTAAQRHDAKYFTDYYNQFNKLGAGRFGFVYGIFPETRAIHTGHDKVHVISGAIRYAATGEELNYNQHLYVATLKPGRWGISGSFSYVSPHDRANDAKNI